MVSCGQAFRERCGRLWPAKEIPQWSESPNQATAFEENERALN